MVINKSIIAKRIRAYNFVGSFNDLKLWTLVSIEFGIGVEI
jgi:hypothetical protein